ncbi:hypothetical protein FGO68_gene2693 [Halteria grandinella]|uniref:FCP1 homology domain-containing protein n=1 Tax=Halteria grandinella TaxID=5974 RepID=A0A8J8T9J3_HALGN|nr:hypothetical protein FGO68_gene2693 [Halteria grandinella]
MLGELMVLPKNMIKIVFSAENLLFISDLIVKININADLWLIHINSLSANILIKLYSQMCSLTLIKIQFVALTILKINRIQLMKSQKLIVAAPSQLKSSNVSPRTSPNLNKLAYRTQVQTPAAGKIKEISKKSTVKRSLVANPKVKEVPSQQPSIQPREDSCFIEQSTLSTQKSNRGTTNQHKEDPNPTTFSNARRISYLDPPSKNTLKNSDFMGDKKKTHDQNKILKSQNFSATSKLASTQLNTPTLQSELFSTMRDTQQQQSYPAQLNYGKQSLGSKHNPCAEQSMQSFNQTQEPFSQRDEQANKGGYLLMDMVEVGRSSESEGESFDESEGNIEQSYITKQLPRAVGIFHNIFQTNQLNLGENQTLERILDEADRKGCGRTDEVYGSTLNLQSTQAQTYVKTVQPSKAKPPLQGIRQAFGLLQLCNNVRLPQKVLPRVEVGEITRSDISHRFSITSRISQGGDCSVPDICTNSSLSNNSRKVANFRQNGSILSAEGPLFPVDHRDPDCKVTHNSCLHMSEEKSSSSSLDGENHNQCSCCQQNNFSNTLKSQLQSKFMINLETVLNQEQKLYSIFEHLKSYTDSVPQYFMDLATLCEDWWSISKDSACLFDIYKIYRDSQTRKILRRALILETITVVLTVHHSHAHNSNKKQIRKLARMQYVTHQNLLHIICMIMQRMGLENCDSNMWAVSLKECVIEKVNAPSEMKNGQIFLMDEAPRNEILTQNNCFLTRKLKRLSKKSPNPQSILFTNIAFFLQEIDKTHINKVKETLVSALNHEASQNIQLSQQQQQPFWQEYQVEDLECDESLNLPNHPLPPVVQDMHLSTIHEDCSYCSLSGSQPPQQQTDYTPISIPYLPPLNTSFRKFTLVLDLDETLIHYVETSFDEESNLSSQYCATNQQNANGNGVGQFLIRPGAHKFLREMSKYYEIVIFTAAMQDYADWVLDQLDVEQCISYRLYRQHAIPAGQFFIKDLSRIGRELSHTLIVDNVAENFQLQPDNGVFIRTWIDDPNDNALDELAPLLKEIVVKRIGDVRDALRIFRIQMMEQVQRGILKPQLSLDYPSANTSHYSSASNSRDDQARRQGAASRK